MTQKTYARFGKGDVEALVVAALITSAVLAMEVPLRVGLLELIAMRKHIVMLRVTIIELNLKHRKAEMMHSSEKCGLRKGGNYYY